MSIPKTEFAPVIKSLVDRFNALDKKAQLEKDAKMAQALYEAELKKELDVESDRLSAMAISRIEEKEKKERKEKADSASLALIEQILQEEVDTVSLIERLLREDNPENPDYESYQKTAAALNRFPAEKRLQALTVLNAIMSTGAVTGAGYDPKNAQNSHTFTRTFIKEGLPVLFKVDDEFSLGGVSPLEPIWKEMKDFPPSVRATIDGNHGRPCPETRSVVEHVLARAWNLAKKLGPSFTESVKASLKNNVEGGGGCIPGIIARLYPIYARMIDFVLKYSLDPAKRKVRVSLD